MVYGKLVHPVVYGRREATLGEREATPGVYARVPMVGILHPCICPGIPPRVHHCSYPLIHYEQAGYTLRRGAGC